MDSPSESSTLRGPVALGALMAAAHGLRFVDPEHALDDAWISFRIARNALDHGVLTFNADLPPVEGMTNLLWTVLSAGWIALLPQVDPIVPARLLGLLLHVGTVVLAVRLVRRVVAAAGGEAARAAHATGLLLGVSGSMAFWAMSGLETPLLTFLLVLALDRLERGRAAAAGLALGALAATRPEGVLLGGLLALGAAVADRPRFLRTAGVYGLSVAALEAFRWTTYGSLVPNTFHAKAPDLAAGLSYVQGFWLYGLGLAGPLLVVPALRDRRVAALIALAGIMLAGAAWSGGDWMPGFRRCSEALVMLTLAAGVGVGLARTGRDRMLLALGLSAWITGNGLAAWKGLDSGLYPHGLMAELGRRAARTPGIEAVALVDIGRFGWEYPGRIVDLVGLVDAERAAAPGGHADKPWDEAWFRGHAPDLLVARSESPVTDPLREPLRLGRPEVGMVRSVLEHGGYHLHTVLQPAEGQWLLLFAADDLELPLDLWGPRSPKDLPQLLLEAADAEQR